MIDRIRHDIQERLERLLAEAEKLGKALAALDPRERERARSAAPRTAAPRAAGSPPAGAAAPRARATATRTPPGETKASVLAALSGSEARTAGEVAKATGLGRGSVSTTLSKLAKSGEVTKAKRGYRLP